MSKQKEFDFNEQNIQLVKNLTNEGLSYKAIARKLNAQGFVTKVKHKKLSDRTIANLLQSPKHKAAYTDSNKVHGKEAKAKDARWKSIEAQLSESQKAEIKAVLECNLDIENKLKLVEKIMAK